MVLRLVQRHVRIAQESLRAGMRWVAERHPDAATNDDASTGNWKRLAQAVGDALRELEDLGSIRDVADEQDKFVSAQAGDSVLGPQERTQRVANSSQELVSGVMPQ